MKKQIKSKAKKASSAKKVVKKAKTVSAKKTVTPKAKAVPSKKIAKTVVKPKLNTPKSPKLKSPIKLKSKPVKGIIKKAVKSTKVKELKSNVKIKEVKVAKTKDLKVSNPKVAAIPEKGLVIKPKKEKVVKEPKIKEVKIKVKKEKKIKEPKVKEIVLSKSEILKKELAHAKKVSAILKKAISSAKSTANSLPIPPPPSGKTKYLKFELEYVVRASPKLLYEFLSTESGLAEWFADDINIRNGIFSFFWDKAEQQAKLLFERENRLIRFQWMEEPKEIYFEFRIETDEMTNDVALLITDYAEDTDSKEAAILLWNAQIEKLLKILGSY